MPAQTAKHNVNMATQQDSVTYFVIGVCVGAVVTAEWHSSWTSVIGNMWQSGKLQFMNTMLRAENEALQQEIKELKRRR